jgi:hypothetical protein
MLTKAKETIFSADNYTLILREKKGVIVSFAAFTQHIKRYVLGSADETIMGLTCSKKFYTIAKLPMNPDMTLTRIKLMLQVNDAIISPRRASAFEIRAVSCYRNER